jgi:hypothetical protein
MILDTNKDGYITVGDLTEILRRRASEGGFQKILSQFNAIAGNGSVSEQGLFDKVKGSPSKGPNMNTTNAPKKSRNPFDTDNSSLMGSVEKFLSSILASSSEKDLILITGNNINDTIEFASILKTALNEELGVKSEIYHNNNDVQLEVNKIDIPQFSEAINQVCSAVSDTFEYATKKIGGIKIQTDLIPNTKSNFDKLDIKLADINYRKFRLRFIKGNQ